MNHRNTSLETAESIYIELLYLVEEFELRNKFSPNELRIGSALLAILIASDDLRFNTKAKDRIMGLKYLEDLSKPYRLELMCTNNGVRVSIV